MPWTNTGIQNIFNTVLRGVPASPAFPVPPGGTPPGTTPAFVGLLLPTPNIDGTFVEVTNPAQWNQYARQVITFGPPTLRTVSNSNLITFSLNATGVVGTVTVTHGGVFALGVIPALAIHPIAFGALATPLTIVNGALVQIPIGMLTITDTIVT